MSITLLTAIFLGLAGAALGARQVLLSDLTNMWPCAPIPVRVAMFLAAVTLGGLAVLFYGHKEGFAGAASPVIATFCGVLALYQTVMFFNVLSQRRPVRVWKRLNRIWIRTCARPKRRRYRSNHFVDDLQNGFLIVLKH